MALLHPWLRLVLSGLVGAVLGVVVGWCTNGAMVEISINAIFATYFGCFFLFLAGIITWRVLEFSATANRKSLLVLSCMMGLSGLICIFYQRHWFFVLGAAYRIPIYTLIGTSVSFALSFSIAELLNFAWTAPWSKVVAPRAQSALVQTPHQVRRERSR